MTRSRRQLLDAQMERDIRQEEILRDAPQNLREKLEWIRDWVEDEWKRSVLGRYQIACTIREIYDDVNEQHGGRYGARAVEMIKAFFEWNNNDIYDALQVAEAFTQEEVEAISQRRLLGGSLVSYSHLVALAEEENEDNRRLLLERTVNQNWSSKQLTNAVKRLAEPTRASKGIDRRGRPVAKPKDFDGVLDQQGSFAEDFFKRLRGVESSRILASSQDT